MPQVALGGIVDVDGYIKRLFGMTAKQLPQWVRKIDHIGSLPKVPGFAEALRDGFKRWHLHHIAGEMVSHKELLRKGMYYRQPWWALRFVTAKEHRKIHAPQQVESLKKKSKEREKCQTKSSRQSCSM